MPRQHELAACAAMERAARFVEQQTPESLRQWALRIETNFAPNEICLPAQDLRNFCDMLNGEIQRLLGHECRNAVQACVRPDLNSLRRRGGRLADC
jgi:hypothetical protein